jgi:predicted permease
MAPTRTSFGKEIRVGGVDFTIVGVAPQEFTGLEKRDFPQSVYIPLAMAPAIGDKQIAGLHAERGTRVLTIRARLRSGVSLRQARADVTSLSDNLERAYPDTNKRQSLIVQTDLESVISTDTVDAGLVVLLSMLSLAVLAVACANVAGLLASRAPMRAREIALRLAVGADRGRLMRQLITESLMLAAAGGAGGLALGYAGIVLIRGGDFFPTDIVQIPAMTLDQRVFTFNLIVAMTSAFLFGLGPAWHATRIDLAAAMKTGDPGHERRRRFSGRGMLVTLQVALSLVVVTLATLTVQEFVRVTVDGPGFRTSHLAKVTVDTDPRRYDLPRAAQFFERAADATRRAPSVTSATLVSYFPLWGFENAWIVPEGYQPPAGQPGIRPMTASIDEDYFRTMGIPLRSGRSFRATDSADSAPVAIVNDTLARRYWPQGNAVGSRFRLGGSDGPWVQIVGIAADSKYFYIIEPAQIALYFPYRQQPHGSMVLLAQTAGESAAVVGTLREIVNGLDKDLATFDGQTIEAFYEARAIGFLRTATEMIGALGVMGILLTMVGLYGLVSYSVSRRTREIGIRIAIGANLCPHSQHDSAAGNAAGMGRSADRPGAERGDDEADAVRPAVHRSHRCAPVSDCRAAAVCCCLVRGVRAGTARSEGRSDDRAPLRVTVGRRVYFVGAAGLLSGAEGGPPGRPCDSTMRFAW